LKGKAFAIILETGCRGLSPLRNKE
jgi:hypothetical protein